MGPRLAFGPAFLRALTRFRARLTVEWGPAVVSALLALVVLAGVAPNAHAATTTQPASYLVGAENTDGGFGMSPGTPSNGEATCWAVLGLTAANGPPATIARAAAWITSHLDQIQTPGDLERTILALAAARAPLGTLTLRLERDVGANGSVNHQANWTAFAILALRAAGIAPAAVTRERTWLARQQNADGSFSFGTRGDPGDIDDTAGALEALVAAGAAPQAERAARHFLASQERRDGGFPLEPGEPSNAQSTAWAAQALVAVHAPAGPALRYLAARITASGAIQYASGML